MKSSKNKRKQSLSETNIAEQSLLSAQCPKTFSEEKAHTGGQVWDRAGGRWDRMEEMCPPHKHRDEGRDRGARLRPTCLLTTSCDTRTESDLRASFCDWSSYPLFTSDPVSLLTCKMGLERSLYSLDVLGKQSIAKFFENHTDLLQQSMVITTIVIIQ